jgi:hypothetical protein
MFLVFGTGFGMGRMDGWIAFVYFGNYFEQIEDQMCINMGKLNISLNQVDLSDLL